MAQAWTAPSRSYIHLWAILILDKWSQWKSARHGGAGRMMNTALWWVSLQTGARLAFGLALWGAYIAQPWLIWLVGAAPG